MKYLGLILVLFCSGAYGDTTLTLGGWSYHLKSLSKNSPLDDYCSSHNMALLNIDGYLIGGYKNSYCEDSFLAGYQYDYKSIQFSAGLASGYSGTRDRCSSIEIGSLCLTASVMYKPKRIPIKVGLMGDAIALAIEIKI